MNDLNALRWQVASLCEGLGLVEHASRLNTTACNAVDVMRQRLYEVRLVATGVHSVAVHAAVSASPAAALVHADTAAKARVLEKYASAAIVAADKVIEYLPTIGGATS